MIKNKSLKSKNTIVAWQSIIKATAFLFLFFTILFSPLVFFGTTSHYNALHARVLPSLILPGSTSRGRVVVDLSRKHRPIITGTVVSVDKKYLVTGFSTSFSQTFASIFNLESGKYTFIKNINESEKIEIKRSALGMSFFPKPTFYPLPDNKGFAHYTDSHKLIIMRSWSGKMIQKIKLRHEVRHLIFHPSMKWFVVELYNRVIFYTAKGKMITQFMSGQHHITSLDFSPDAQTFLIQTHGNMTTNTKRLLILLNTKDVLKNKKIKVVWNKDVSQKEYLGNRKIKFQISDGARFDPSGKKIIYGYTRPDRMGIYSISTKDGTPLSNLTVQTNPVFFAFTKDGSRFYAAHSEGGSASKGLIAPVTSWSFYHGDWVLNKIYKILPSFGAGRIDILSNEKIIIVSRPSGGSRKIVFYNTKTDASLELLVFSDGRWLVRDNKGNYDHSKNKVPLRLTGKTKRYPRLVRIFARGGL